MQQWQQVPTAPHDEKLPVALSIPAPIVHMGFVFFSGSCCVVFAGLLGICYYLYNLSDAALNPFDMLTEVYLIFFGALMCFMDVPLQFKCLIKLKIIIGKYARVLTRLTGKGIWFLFLGCTTFATLYERMGEPIWAILLGGFVTLLGLLATSLGVLKSMKSDRVRQKIMQMGSEGLDELIKSHMSISQHLGMSKAEFGELCTDVSSIHFDDDELSLLFNALTSENSAGNSSTPMITQDNIYEWAEEGLMMFL